MKRIMRATEEASVSEIGKSKLLKEDEVEKILKQHQPTNTCLDLIAKSILTVPENLFRLPNLESLHLQSNHLEELPEEFFENLPMLKWLDLRDNKLEYLPAGIGIHRNLKNFLLERNQLTHLPPELGNVTSITGLSLRGNPLVTPPPEIVELGVQSILSYLLDVLNATDIVSEDNENGWQYTDDNMEGYSDEEDDKLSIQSANGGVQYNEPELSFHGPTPIPAKFHQPKLRSQFINRPLRNNRFNGSSSAKVKVKEITLTNGTNGTKKEGQMDRKNWLAKMQQKKQDTMVLDEWRREAKRLQNLLVPKSRNGNESSSPERSAPLPPYGVDIPSEGRPITHEERQIHIDAVEEKVNRVEPKIQKYPKGRIDDEVQARIRQHTSRLRTRKQKDQAKKKMLQPGRELQRELLDQKMSLNPEMEYRFRAFTGDSSSFSSSKKTTSM